jgi:hypothetical protein
MVFETGEDYLVEFINGEIREVFDVLAANESELQKHKKQLTRYYILFILKLARKSLKK